MKLHFLDLPGVGTENRRPCPSTVPAIRVELAQRFHREIARGALPKGPWSLLSISMGAMIGLDWSYAEPDLFQKLILINTSSADTGSPTERLRAGLLPRIFFTLVTNRPDTVERTVLRLGSNRFARDESARDPKLRAIYADQVKWRRERPVTRTALLHQFIAASRFHLPEGRPKAEVFCVSAEGDRVVRPKCTRRLAERIGATRVSHPWAGHDLPIDDPEWLAREIVDWMERPR
jgi:pimeloyl-ACP methyl ester carboxylesterase